MRIVFGLSNTLADIDEFGCLKLRPGVLELLQELKLDHTLILWTGQKKARVRSMKLSNSTLFGFFSEVYCKEDIETMQDIPGCSEHQFKNIEKIKADCLIDSKKSYETYSSNLLMGEKYLIIDKYRECLYKYPTPWKIRVVGSDVIEKWEKRNKEKESWVFDVLSFVERIEAKKGNDT